jgi:hypothetical protein
LRRRMHQNCSHRRCCVAEFPFVDWMNSHTYLSFLRPASGQGPRTRGELQSDALLDDEAQRRAAKGDRLRDFAGAQGLSGPAHARVDESHRSQRAAQDADLHTVSTRIADAEKKSTERRKTRVPESWAPVPPPAIVPAKSGATPPPASTETVTDKDPKLQVYELAAKRVSMETAYGPCCRACNLTAAAVPIWFFLGTPCFRGVITALPEQACRRTAAVRAEQSDQPAS